MIGALLPDVVDAVFGGAALLHSVVGSIVLLAVVMLATIGHRSWRRHLIALPIGTFLHLVFDGAFTSAQAFWWPLTGGSVAERPLPVPSGAGGTSCSSWSDSPSWPGPGAGSDWPTRHGGGSSCARDGWTAPW